jgi:4-hydroxy-3-methylbut-2-enyl diphosphate reductase
MWNRWFRRLSRLNSQLILKALPWGYLAVAFLSYWGIMKIVLSKTMGYCNGVSRALDLAEQAIEEAKGRELPVYSLGKLIHNRQVCEHFRDEGLEEIAHPEGHDTGVVILRAHGIPDRLRSEFVDAGFTLIDATCSVVKRNLRLIAKYSKTHSILVVGHKGHPESIAMQGVMVEGSVCPSILLCTVEDVRALPKGRSYAVFVQTTFDQQLWTEIRSALVERTQTGSEMFFVNEICPNSINRRQAVIELAEQCDAVVVIGGKESANTRALYTLALEMGKPAWHIEDASHVVPEMYEYATLGVTAGASTPSSLIDEVVQRLQQE